MNDAFEAWWQENANWIDSRRQITQKAYMAGQRQSSKGEPMSMSASTEKDLYWAIRGAQDCGMSLEQFLIKVKNGWIAERQEQLAREQKEKP